ncbi:MAG TPA: hypothetical protein VMC41_04250 [Candidatus Nanoarchaeia archaeon]|nr:hypothetical protein [Candidatus Nanoarchaeia archaeon]
MKISLNIKFAAGPSGGGNQFALSLRDYLSAQGVTVVTDLIDKDIDVIFHIVPFPFLMKAGSYTFLDAYLYKLKKPDTVIIHRVNECDERKGTRYLNRMLIRVAKYSDALVFIASWLKPLLEKQGLDTAKPNKVILQGADSKIFNLIGKEFWDRTRKLRIVTHHWSDNYLKGHDFYHRLDDLLSDPAFGAKFEFTYIGNYPKNLVYKNTRLIKPLSGLELAAELKRNDVYLTASRHEPAGMHHIEGALCGLPILYLDSGALKEYCQDFGLEFNQENFPAKLLEMYDNFEIYEEKIKKYRRTAEAASADYYEFIKNVYAAKSAKNSRPDNFKIAIFSIYRIFYRAYWRIRSCWALLKNKFLKIFL